MTHSKKRPNQNDGVGEDNRKKSIVKRNDGEGEESKKKKSIVSKSRRSFTVAKKT